MMARDGLNHKRWLQRGRWAALLAVMLWGAALAGCGKGGDAAEEEAPPPDDEAGMAEAPPADAEAPPPDAMGGEMAPEPGMEGMPGATPEAAPAPAAADGGTPIAVAPLHPVRTNPFGALDGPEQPEPPPPILPPPPSSQQLMPIRATVEVRLPEGQATGPEETRLPDVRTSGILWGPTVKAIVQYRDASGAEQSAVVKPGDELPIRSPGGTQLTVLSIGPDGVQLQNVQTRRIYFAPLQGR